ISIGTRGDMEPFLAIGRILKDRGHTVTCLFPEQFRDLVADAGFAFASLGTGFMDMLNSDLGRYALGGGGSWLRKVMAFVKLARVQARNNREMVQLQYELTTRLRPDRIVHNGKAMVPVLWEVDHPGSTVYISPVPYLHYVKGHTHTAFHSNYGEWLNRLTYRLADWGVTKAILASARWLGLSGITKAKVTRALKEHSIIYTVSPQLFARPPYWSANMRVLGYHERDKTTNWQPDEALLHFLDRHGKLLFVTFGSMTNPDPEGKTAILMEVLRKHRIPAVINTSSGGLVEPADYDRELFHFVHAVPYDWIFPRMHAVIHHGGSGTTHMAVRNGCASLVIPHVIDQFDWDRTVHEKGLGPRGIPVARMSARELAPRILSLMNDPTYKRNAEALAERMRQEQDLEDELYRAIVGDRS
ncbi:MAG: glycosyltransferase family 1 protein, partial [Flavobacteriales bacterium]|nr:glycosyltransferase family 1 protein [Flavobacteriales bacterium]